MPASQEVSEKSPQEVSKKDWRICEQGLQTSKLQLDVAGNGDGYVVSFRTLHDFYKIYFSPSGKITHARHYDVGPHARVYNESAIKTPLAATQFHDDRAGKL